MADDSLASFGRRIRVYGSRIIPGAEEAVQDASSAVARELLVSTPADTGRAITNWDATLGPKPAEYREAAVPGAKGSTRVASIGEAIGRMLDAIRGYRAGGPAVNITNAAPYIEQLNQGSSKQAPAGFVEAAIQRGRAAVANVRIVSKVS